ncbi:MAG: hypothetical protein J6C23_09195 [Clostridia bacterium]|nr:hypothetical protein [Clostridia bacterium]
MNKTFKPAGYESIVMKIMAVLNFGISAVSMICFLFNFIEETEQENISIFLIGGVVTFAFAVFLLIVGVYKIVFDDEKIHITKQFGDKPTQDEDTIYYSEIKNVRKIRVCIDTKGFWRINKNGAKVDNIFFHILLKDGSVKLILISDFTVSQQKKMLEIINNQTGLNLDYDKLEFEDLTEIKDIKKVRDIVFNPNVTEEVVNTTSSDTPDDLLNKN